MNYKNINPSVSEGINQWQFFKKLSALVSFTKAEKQTKKAKPRTKLREDEVNKNSGSRIGGFREFKKRKP